MAKKLPAVHPGEILKEEFLAPMEISMNRLALETRMPATRVGEIVAGRRSISAETALRLGRYFNVSPEFWTNLQSAYDLEMARDELGDRLEREVEARRA